jgi:carbamate kinase
MRIVIALGGNALLRRGDPMTTQVQRRNIMIAAEGIAGILVLSVALDYGWKRFHATRAKDVQLAH